MMLKVWFMSVQTDGQLKRRFDCIAGATWLRRRSGANDIGQRFVAVSKGLDTPRNHNKINAVIRFINV